MPWANRNKRPIPTTGSRESTLELNDYSLGFNSFLSNDKVPVKNGGSNLWRLAQDARISTLGEYGTRKGIDYHSDAAGKTQDQAITSTTGAANQEFDQTHWLAQKFTAGASQRLTMVDINLKNPDGATGTVMVEIWSDVSSAPGVLMARSSIAGSDLTSSYAYLTARFATAPLLTSTSSYWIVVYVQPIGGTPYNWSSTTSATTALTSSDSGTTWASTTYALNFKEYYATDGQVKGLHRAYKSDGTKVTLFAQGTSLYSVNDATGALTAIKTGLNASATRYRFVTVNDVVYYVNSYDGLRKWDFTTESQVNSTNYSNLVVHKGLLFLAPTSDPNQLVYSNFADYETFTSTDFIYVPSPKTGDPITALRSLNGYLLMWTLKNKYILSGSDNATFTLDEAPDQKGTYRQETTTQDKNFVYYLSDDGVYRSNGSEATLLSSDVYDDVAKLPNKDSATMVVNKGRLYLWYTPLNEVGNSKCYVFSLNFGDSGGTTESLDTNTFVSRAVSGFKDSDTLLVGSSRVGQVYWLESSSNDYTSLGDNIDFELRTHYFVGASPAVLKEYRYWQPRFASQSGSYTISCEFANDLRDNWEAQSTPNVQGVGAIWGSFVWGDGSIWGTTKENQSYLYVPGEARRTAIRYKHYATRQPHTFLGHTLVSQTRRLR